MHSGKVPQELHPEDFSFLKNTSISFIYGTKDEYLQKGIIEVEEKRLTELFPGNLEILRFEGGHEVNTDLISKFA